MAQAGLLQVPLRRSVAARGLQGDQPLRFTRWDAEIENEIFAGEAVDFVFKVLDPLQEFRALRGGNARGLMRQIGGDVAIHENNLAASDRARYPRATL